MSTNEQKKRNQNHGKREEDYLKKAFPGSENYQSGTKKDDIPANFDVELGIVTSIKALKKAKNIVIPLADARRFWKTNQPTRLIVSVYEQTGEEKVTIELREYILQPDTFKKLIGPVEYENVEKFHFKIKEIGYGPEQKIKYLKEIKKSSKEINNMGALVKVNAKIDNKNQRRLQCSVSMNNLEKVVKPIVYVDTYKGLAVKHKI
jgi:hypothetical protein